MSVAKLLHKAFFSGLIAYSTDFIAIVCSISGFNLSNCGVFSWISQHLGWRLTFAIGLIVLLIRIIYVIYHEYKILEENVELKYNPFKIQEQFNNALKIVLQLNNEENAERDTLSRQMVYFCTSAKAFFERLTGSRCCVSIKVLSNDSPVIINSSNIVEMNVINLLRDSEHAYRDTETYKNTEHKIRSNTAYITIIDKIKSGKQKKFYLSKNVDVDNEYQSTSINCYGQDGLPYKSELVFPLMEQSATDSKLYSFIGFLCIDSEQEAAFSAKGIEVHYAEIFACVVSGILKKYWQQIGLYHESR